MPQFLYKETNNWFTRMQAFQATKKYLESKPKEELIKLLKATIKETLHDGHKRSDGYFTQKKPVIGAGIIARFLSTDEQTVSKDEVASLLKMGENLAPELLQEVEKAHDKLKEERIKLKEVILETHQNQNTAETGKTKSLKPQTQGVQREETKEYLESLSSENFDGGHR